MLHTHYSRRRCTPLMLAVRQVKTKEEDFFFFARRSKCHMVPTLQSEGFSGCTGLKAADLWC